MTLSLLSTWNSFKQHPTGDFFTQDGSLLYMGTLAGGRGPMAISHFISNTSRKMVVTEKVINTLVNDDTIMEEVEAKVELKMGGGWLVPGVDEQFIVGQTVEIPLLKVVKFVGDKIQAMRVYHDQASVLKQLNLIGERNRWPIISKDQVTAIAYPNKIMLNRYNPGDTYVAASGTSNGNHKDSGRVTRHPGGNQTFSLFETEYNGPNSVPSLTNGRVTGIPGTTAFMTSEPAEFRPSAKINAPPGGKTSLNLTEEVETPTKVRTGIRVHQEEPKSAVSESPSRPSIRILQQESKPQEESVSRPSIRIHHDEPKTEEALSPPRPSIRIRHEETKSEILSSSRPSIRVHQQSQIADDVEIPPRPSVRIHPEKHQSTNPILDNESITQSGVRSSRTGKANESTFAMSDGEATQVNGGHKFKSSRTGKANESSFTISDGSEDGAYPRPTHYRSNRTGRANESSISLSDGFVVPELPVNRLHKPVRSAKANESQFSLQDVISETIEPISMTTMTSSTEKLDKPESSINDNETTAMSTSTVPVLRKGIRSGRANESSLDLTGNIPQNGLQKKQTPVYRITNPPGGKSSLGF